MFLKLYSQITIDYSNLKFYNFLLFYLNQILLIKKRGKFSPQSIFLLEFNNFYNLFSKIKIETNTNTKPTISIKENFNPKIATDNIAASTGSKAVKIPAREEEI